MPKGIPNKKRKFKMTTRRDVKANGHDHASRVQAATLARNDALRVFLDRCADHHAATLDALTATATAAGFAA